LITGPRGAGAAGAAWTGWTFVGFPNCPIGPYAIATTNTTDATIAAKIPAKDSEVIRNNPSAKKVDITEKMMAEIGQLGSKLARTPDRGEARVS
jgi:hypothetical protein